MFYSFPSKREVEEGILEITKNQGPFHNSMEFTYPTEPTGLISAAAAALPWPL